MIYTGFAKKEEQNKNILAKGNVTIIDTIPDENGNHPKINWTLEKNNN